MTKPGPGEVYWDDRTVQNAVREVTQHDNVANVRQLVFDVRNFHDPHHAQYRNHCGYHWGIIDGLTQQTQQAEDLLVAVHRAITRERPQPTLLAFVCRSGRHRAVAWACIFDRLLRWCIPGPQFYLSESFYAKTDYHIVGCKYCEECMESSTKREIAIDRIAGRWEALCRGT
jgi:hypothetical protein